MKHLALISIVGFALVGCDTTSNFLTPPSDRAAEAGRIEEQLPGRRLWPIRSRRTTPRIRRRLNH